MKIRLALEDDLPRLLELFEIVRNFMKQTGNLNQWIDGYPQLKLIEEDVAAGHCYVCEGLHHRVVATFCLIEGPDKTYSYIEGYGWPSNSPYFVIHRLASDGTTHGVAKVCIDWCAGNGRVLRADTHQDNHIMQHLLVREGFVFCGIIYVFNGSPRLAFQRG